MQYLHPSQNVVELRRYEQLGELAYVAERKREAMEFIRADYGRFAWISIKRFIYYWGGLAAVVGNSGAGAVQEFGVSRVFGAGLLGTGASTCASASRGHGCFFGSFCRMRRFITLSSLTLDTGIRLSRSWGS